MRFRITVYALSLCLLFATTQSQTTPQNAPVRQTNDIADPAERNAYMGALGISNPQAQAAFEKFLQEDPNSVVKKDSLVQLMLAYDRAKDEGKAIDAANRLLQLNSNHVRALAFLAFTKRAVAEAGVDETKNAAAAFQYGMRGLEALKTFPKPLGMSDDNFEKFKVRTTIIFEGAAGFGSQTLSE